MSESAPASSTATVEASTWRTRRERTDRSMRVLFTGHRGYIGVEMVACAWRGGA